MNKNLTLSYITALAYIIGITGLLMILFVLGTFFGMSIQTTQEPKIEHHYIKTNEIKFVDVCYNDTTYTTYNTPTNITTPSKTVDRLMYPYGGVPTSINNPPNDAVISKELTEKNNNHTIAIDSYNNKYYFVGEWGWFNQSEYDALPYKNKLYDVSPYWNVMN